jgi:hypothetical protein
MFLGLLEGTQTLGVLAKEFLWALFQENPRGRFAKLLDQTDGTSRALRGNKDRCTLLLNKEGIFSRQVPFAQGE